MELNYKTFGQGPPLIILHGLFGTLDNWQTLAKRFAEHYSVYIVDQRNHGKSPHDSEMSYPLLAEDLRNFMESKWMFKAHILGHSMGGKAAMQFALQFPDFVDHLIIVDMHPRANEGGHELIFDAMLSLELDKLKSRKEADQLLAEKITDFGVRQFLLKNLSRDKENDSYRWKMNLKVLHKHYAAILAAVASEEAFDGPTLFIKGERSDYIIADHWEEVLQPFPNASLQTISDAGHWVHADAPEELEKIVLTFLQEN